MIRKRNEKMIPVQILVPESLKTDYEALVRGEYLTISQDLRHYMRERVGQSKSASNQ